MKKRTLYYKLKTILISSVVIFLLMTFVTSLTNFLIIYLVEHHLLTISPDTSLYPFLIQTGILSIFVGTILWVCISYIPLRIIHTLTHAIHEVADGNYETKIHFSQLHVLQDLAQSFNQMTDELSGIEILRTDFINNFSHEFKTPIVSILGFAKLLKKEN